MAVQVQESVTSDGVGMTVTVEQVKAVQAAMLEAQEHDIECFLGNLERKAEFEKASGTLAFKVAEAYWMARSGLGSDAWRRNGELKLDLLAAEAAIAVVREAYGTAENPGAPAVAKVGDVYQHGDTIAPNVTKLSTACGEYPAGLHRAPANGWWRGLDYPEGWGKDDTSGSPWEPGDFPLTVTAISEPAKREPRVFEAGDVIPDDVTELVAPDGRTYHLRENGAFSITLDTGHLERDTSKWCHQWPDRFPLMEGATTDGWEMH